MNIVFMGSPEFAVPALEALIKSEHNVVAVYSQPPRPAGRGQKEKPTSVHALALQHNIPAFTPEKLTGDAVTELENLKPDLICVAAYGLLLPKSVLDIAPCLNIHPSALPRWRGAAPMHRTVLAGDTTTDMCIMHMEEGLDTGPIYLRKPFTVGENETTGELHDRMALEGGVCLLNVVNNWATYKSDSIPQEGEAVYAHKFKPEQLKEIRKLDFSKSAEDVHNQIRGLSPWPGAVMKHNGEDIKVLKSTIENTESTGNAGEIMSVSAEKISVSCAKGSINLHILQRSGKKAIPVSDFIRGYSINVQDSVL